MILYKHFVKIEIILSYPMLEKILYNTAYRLRLRMRVNQLCPSKTQSRTELHASVSYLLLCCDLWCGVNGVCA